MNLNEYLNDLQLNVTIPQIKAFFLGSMIGKKPLKTDKAITELLPENPITPPLHAELAKLWENLNSHKEEELKNLFLKTSEFSTSLEFSKEQLDFFLTGLGLAGTSADSNEESLLGEILEELEDLVLDMDDYLASHEQTSEETAAIEEDLQTLWTEFLKTRQ
jgi:hypothetical protein